MRMSVQDRTVPMLRHFSELSYQEIGRCWRSTRNPGYTTHGNGCAPYWPISARPGNCRRASPAVGASSSNFRPRA
jgi:hypothetical protein